MKIFFSEPAKFRLKLQIVSLTSALVCLLILIFYAFSHRETILWDFQKDYTAALLFRHGYNPYDNNLLSHIGSVRPDLQYLYPLATTFLFMPFTYLDYSRAALIWLSLILFILSVLILIWWHFYTDNISNALFPTLAFLIFNLALPKNVITGNINTVETALIWLGLLALTKGRTNVFSVLIGAAAVFKIYPLILVGIMLVHKDTRHWHESLMAILTVLTVLTASFLLQPSWFSMYQGNIAHTIYIFGYTSLYAVCYCIFMGTGLSEMQQHVSGLVAYCGVCTVLGWLAFATFRRLSAAAWSDTGITIIMYACLTYALMLPRFTDYNYLLIIPAAWYAFRTTLHERWMPMWLGVFVLPLFFVDFHNDGDFLFGLWSGWNLFVLVVAWGHLTYAVLRKSCTSSNGIGQIA
jgi:hypothetical protein